MNASASMGPVQTAIVVYIICIVIALCVAGVIKLLVGYIKLQQRRTAAKAAAETGSHH